MDQVKIGNFLRELRKEKALTQEQLAERFGVSGRTVSRWENGNNLPDISILIDLAEFYDLDIREIIDGERKSENMDKEIKDTLVKVAEYTTGEKVEFLKELLCDSVVGLICTIGVLVSLFLTDIGKNTISFAIIFSCVAIGALVSAIKNILRINGNINKSSYKKMEKIALAIGIPLILLSVLLVLIMVFV